MQVVGHCIFMHVMNTGGWSIERAVCWWKGWQFGPQLLQTSSEQVTKPLIAPGCAKFCFESSLHKNNGIICSLFQNNCISVLYVIEIWNNAVKDICWEKTCTLLNRYLLVNKVKKVSVKIFLYCYSVKTFLIKFRKTLISLAVFVVYIQTVYHLLWTCELTCSLWQSTSHVVLNISIATLCYVLKIFFLFGWFLSFFGLYLIRERSRKWISHTCIASLYCW